MKKINISLSQLERIESPHTTSPKDLMIEQEQSYNDDGSYTHYYKCPCGKGQIVDDKDATPGFRSHDIFIKCNECSEKYEIR